MSDELIRFSALKIQPFQRKKQILKMGEKHNKPWQAWLGLAVTSREARQAEPKQGVLLAKPRGFSWLYNNFFIRILTRQGAYGLINSSHGLLRK